MYWFLFKTFVLSCVPWPVRCEKVDDRCLAVVLEPPLLIMYKYLTGVQSVVQFCMYLTMETDITEIDTKKES
jgi:hypothetical protein